MIPEERRTFVMYGIEDTPKRMYIRLGINLFIERVFGSYIR